MNNESVTRVKPLSEFDKQTELMEKRYSAYTARQEKDNAIERMALRLFPVYIGQRDAPADAVENAFYAATIWAEFCESWQMQREQERDEIVRGIKGDDETPSNDDDIPF